MLTRYIMRIALTLVLNMGFIFTTHAGIEVREFSDSSQEQRYHKLVDELRCLVCQNQNLADSNSKLAVDLRNKIYTMIKAQRSDQYITDYMVDRFGKFVLYNPPLDSVTAILWIGPFLFIILAMIFLFLTIISSSKRKIEPLNEADQTHSRKLLNEKIKP